MQNIGQILTMFFFCALQEKNMVKSLNSKLCTLIEKFWRISLYVIDDATAKLYFT